MGAPHPAPRPGAVDAVICLGCVIRGETTHYELRGRRVRPRASSRSSSTTGVPVAFGVLTTEDQDQALARSEGAGGHNVGEDAARRRRRDGPPGRSATARPDADRFRPSEPTAYPRPRAAPRPAQGLAGEGHPRAVRGGRPRASSARSTVDYKATIDDPRIDDVRILRPQEIPTYVAEGLFDLGITGRDWVEETASDVVILGELQYSKAIEPPVPHRARRAAGLAVRAASRTCPQGVRVSTRVPGAHPPLLRRARHRGRHPAVATAPPRRRCPTSSTASSTAPRPAGPCGPPGCKIIDEVLASYTELIANPAAVRRPGQAPRHGADQDAARRRAWRPGARCW